MVKFSAILNHRLARKICLYTAFAGGLVSPSRAENFTLTDTQGRSIQADVLSIENEIARIRRADGMRFDLPLANLAEADQKKLRDWAKQEADKPLPANSIQVTASRSKFDSSKKETEVPWVTTYSDGSSTTEYRTLVTTTEHWGYSLTVSNTTLRQIENLRLEYRLFGSGPRNAGGSASTLEIGTLKPRAKTILKTTTLTFSKEAYRGTSAKPTGSQLRGVWVRVYRGGELVHESSTPDNLRLDEVWTASSSLNAGPSLRQRGIPQ